MNMLQRTLSRGPHSTIWSRELCQIRDKSPPQTPRIPPASHKSQPKKTPTSLYLSWTCRQRSQITRCHRTILQAQAHRKNSTNARLPCFCRSARAHPCVSSAIGGGFAADRELRHVKTSQSLAPKLAQKVPSPRTARIRGDPAHQCPLNKENAVPEGQCE